MPRLVDGDNLLGTWPGRRRSDPERRALAAEIFRLATRERRRIVVVFDGPVPPVPPPTHEVHFSGPGRTADSCSHEMVEAAPFPGDPSKLRLHQIYDLGFRIDPRVERCKVFRDRLLQREDGEKPEGPVDVDEWLRIFGEGGSKTDG